MLQHPSRLFLIFLLGFVVIIASFIGYSALRSSPGSQILQTSTVGDPIPEIAGYRGWSKVNDEPQLMPDRTATLCAPVNALQLDESKNPHHKKYLTVYVNGVGRSAMLEQLRPTFPEGSVIVKEKLENKTSQTPELMTVMIKRGKGFNPRDGDWEYMVVDGNGTRVLDRGKLDACETCHTLVKFRTDYVFRTYLTDEAVKKLK
jgi:Cytochrome P460